MKRLKWFFIIVCSALLVSACAVQRISPSEASNRKIAVFSDLSDNFHMAVTGLEADQFIISVVGWNLDSYVENNLAEKLREKGEVPILINKPKGFPLMKDRQSVMMDLSKKTNADLMITVTPLQQYRVNASPAGYGIWEHHSIWGRERQLYASIHYQIYSVKTGDILAYYEVGVTDDTTLKLPTTIPFYKLTMKDILKLLPKMHDLMNTIDEMALKEMGLQ